MCRRLTLACADTGDELHFINDFETEMIQLCYVLKISQNQAKSAKQIKEIQNLQENQKKAIKSEKRADTTKCMILEVTVDGVSKEYSYLIHAFRGLQQDLKSVNVSNNMLKKIDNIKLLSTVYILKFMLPHPKTI